jgi:hypothetical protein
LLLCNKLNGIKSPIVTKKINVLSQDLTFTFTGGRNQGDEQNRVCPWPCRIAGLILISRDNRLFAFDLPVLFQNAYPSSRACGNIEHTILLPNIFGANFAR